MTVGGCRWPLSPHSVTSIPVAPKSAAAVTASRALPRALDQRPTNEFQPLVPGHTHQSIPAPAKRSARGPNPR